MDKDRPKKASNDECKHPNNEDARITKMKDGRTHLAHKLEHAVDMDNGAILAMTVYPISGDTQSIEQTLTEAEQHVQRDGLAVQEVVCDKGYHSNATMKQLAHDIVRSYVSEPRRRQRRWAKYRRSAATDLCESTACTACAASGYSVGVDNCWSDRSAHLLETGGMRRLHLRGHENASGCSSPLPPFAFPGW